MVRARGWSWWGAALAMTALGACGIERPRIERPTMGEPLADVALVDLRGDTVALSDLRGSPVLVNLWATWCPPCRAETPFLQSLHARYRPRGLQVVGIALDNAQARAAVDVFLAENQVDYLQLLDPGGISMDLYAVIGLPASFLVDGDGIVRFARLGPIVESDPEFERALEAVLGS